MLLLTGCWGLMELQEVHIVAGVGIDKKESGEFEVTNQSVKPLAIKEALPDAHLTRSSTGLTIFDAVREFIITAGKKQLWEHVEILIINQNIAREGITPVIDFLYRDHEPRPKMKPFISREEAKMLLNLKSEIEPIPAFAIEEALKEQRALGKAPDVELHEFVEMLQEKWQDPYLPMITKGEQDFEIYGTAIFKGDQMIGELTPRETLAMLRVKSELEGGLQIVNLNPNSKTPIYASLEIKSTSAKIQAEFENGEPIITIDIEEHAVIGDIGGHEEINIQTYKDIEKIYEETIKQESEKVIHKIQKEMKANIFSFADVIRRKEKGFWKKNQEQWEEIYPTVTVRVNVNAEIIHNQLIRDSLGNLR